MWRTIWFLLLFITITACTGAGNSTAESVETSVAATLTTLARQEAATPNTNLPTNTPRPADTAPINTPPSTDTTAPTNTPRPSATPDPRLWNAILGYQDVGVPLPKSARTFGGGIYVPDGTVLDVQSAQFSDEVVVGVGAYYPNAYDGEVPILLPDGTDVAKVEFFLFDPNGNTAYQGIDDTKPFCLFGDTNGRCTSYTFEDNACQWLAGNGSASTPVVAGFYQLNVALSSPDSLEEVWFATLDIRISPDSPCATPREVFHDHFDLSGCCNENGQRNDEVLSAEVFVTTTGYLGAEILLSAEACSDVAFHLFVDNAFVATTEFVGPLAGGWDGSGYMTGYLELGEYPPGTYTLQVSPEGREGGCNNGVLNNWGGMVNAYYSQSQ
jgi:hypothetical protein